MLPSPLLPKYIRYIFRTMGATMRGAENLAVKAATVFRDKFRTIFLKILFAQAIFHIFFRNPQKNG